ncbi:hypothetical protein LLG95_10205 [bacterium]|nr:hypothetical protein [bacterium]
MAAHCAKAGGAKVKAMMRRIEAKPGFGFIFLLRLETGYVGRDLNHTVDKGLSQAGRSALLTHIGGCFGGMGHMETDREIPDTAGGFSKKTITLFLLRLYE